MGRGKTVTVLEAPITDRYFKKGMEALFDEGRNFIRLDGVWFNFDSEKWKIAYPDQDKRESLACLLESEYERLKNGSVRSNQLHEYADTLKYLRTGYRTKDYEDNDLLTACVEDLETMYLDYGVEALNE